MIARVAWPLLIALAVGGTACERLIGIHGPRDGGAGDTAGAGGGGSGGGAPDAPIDRPGDGVAMDAPATDAATDRAGDGVAPGTDGGLADRPDAGPTDGAGGDGGADAGHCGAPWHAESASAGVYTIASSATTACGFAASTLPTLTAALDTTNFRGALACGSCLRVQPSFGTTSVVVQVVDLASATTGILLNQAAIDRVATPGTSSLTVDWQLVPCDVQDQNVAYYIKDGTNANYVGVQIRRQRYPVTSVVAVGSHGQMVPFALQTYNFWESTVSGIGAAPLTLQLTDINNQIIQDTGIAVTPQTQTSGSAQFPICQ